VADVTVSGPAAAVLLPGARAFRIGVAGEPLAIGVRQRFLANVASAVQILVLSVDVETVVIGGASARSVIHCSREFARPSTTGHTPHHSWPRSGSPNACVSWRLALWLRRSGQHSLGLCHPEL